MGMARETRSERARRRYDRSTKYVENSPHSNKGGRSARGRNPYVRRYIQRKPATSLRSSSHPRLAPARVREPRRHDGERRKHRLVADSKSCPLDSRTNGVHDPAHGRGGAPLFVLSHRSIVRKTVPHMRGSQCHTALSRADLAGLCDGGAQSFRPQRAPSHRFDSRRGSEASTRPARAAGTARFTCGTVRASRRSLASPGSPSSFGHSSSLRHQPADDGACLSCRNVNEPGPVDAASRSLDRVAPSHCGRKSGGSLRPPWIRKPQRVHRHVSARTGSISVEAPPLKRSTAHETKLRGAADRHEPVRGVSFYFVGTPASSV